MTGLDYLPKPILRRPSGDLSCGNSCASSQRRVRISARCENASSSIQSAKSALSSASSVDEDHQTASTSPSCEEGYESDATEVTSNTGTDSKPSPTTPTRRSSISSLRRKTREFRSGGSKGSKSSKSSCQSSKNSKKKTCTCGASSGGGRWDSGSSKCTCKGGNTASPTSLVAAIKSSFPDSSSRRQGGTTRGGSKRRINLNQSNNEPSLEAEQKSPTSVIIQEEDKYVCDAPVPDLVCDDLDLKSKPGIIEVELEEEEELIDDAAGDHGSLQDRSATGSCTKSTTSARSKASSASSYNLLTDLRVRTFLKDYYEDFDSVFRLGKSNSSIWDAFFKQYYTEDILWVRSSSNTLKGPELADHFANHIVGIQMCLVSIDSIQILPGGMTAVVVYTADQEFLYNGHPVADRSVLSTVLHLHLDDSSSRTLSTSAGECEERILISHEHRCVGKPIPTKENRWETNP